ATSQLYYTDAIALTTRRSSDLDRPKGRPFGDAPTNAPETPSADRLRYVKEEGHYAAGELAQKKADKIPHNGGLIVLQLATWQVQIGRASCRGRVESTVGAVAVN